MREEVELVTGVVRFFKEPKGFGFVIPEKGGPDIFLHASVIPRDTPRGVQSGDRVVGTVEDKGKGLAFAVIKEIKYAPVIDGRSISGAVSYEEVGVIELIHAEGFGWVVTQSRVRVWIPHKLVSSAPVVLLASTPVRVVYHGSTSPNKNPRAVSISLL